MGADLTTIIAFPAYQINVKPDLPVINVGTIAQPSYLPVDVCEVMSGQPAKSKLSPNQTRQMLNFAVRSPAKNARSIVTKGTETLGIGDPANPTLVLTPLSSIDVV